MIVEPPVNAVCRLRRQTALRFSPKAKYGKRSGAGLVTSLMRHSVTKLREATRHGAKNSRPSLSAGKGHRRSLLADLLGAHERQPLEHGSVQVRIGHVADPLGPGGHGSMHAPDHWLRRPCRYGRWWRTLSDVQPRHSRATPDAELPVRGKANRHRSTGV